MMKYRNIIIYFFVILFAISFDDAISHINQCKNFRTSDTIKIFNLTVRDSDLILTSNHGVHLSNDLGNSWTNINYNCENAFTYDTSFIYYLRVIRYNGEKTLAVWGSSNYFYFLNQNEKLWKRCDYFKENNLFFEDIIEFNNKYIASTLDSGLFVSENLINWKKLNNFQCKGFDHFFINAGDIYLNNFEFQFTLKGNMIEGYYKKFYTPKNTSGYFVFDDSIMFVSSRNGIFLSSNEGNNWQNITTNISESLNKTYMFPVLFYDKILYCCLDDGIYIYSKSENSWNRIFSPCENNRLLIWNMIKIKNLTFIVSWKYGLLYSSDGINFNNLNVKLP